MGLPLLMIAQESEENTHYHPSLFSLTEKTLIQNIQQNFDENKLDQEFQCVGSSHGWLGFSEQNVANPILYNPFYKTHIILPPNDQHLKIKKLVLCGDPFNDHNYTFIAMHSKWLRTTIAYSRPDDVGWADLGSELDAYDVVCCDATKTAYILGPGPTVEAWDIKGAVPRKRMVISETCPAKLAHDQKVFPINLYSSQWYLALSEFRQLFLAVRYIGCFVRPCDGEVVEEGDTLTEYASEPLVCPYKTKGFYVFKYDVDEKEWVEVEGLGDDCAMFVGGNQTLMVKTGGEVKGNAIYFTDDNWDEMNLDYSYGGHDMGIFSMGDGSFQPVFGCQEQRIVPSPFWISVPSFV